MRETSTRLHLAFLAEGSHLGSSLDRSHLAYLVVGHVDKI
jgi:hypothetical protein